MGHLLRWLSSATLGGLVLDGHRGSLGGTAARARVGAIVAVGLLVTACSAAPLPPASAPVAPGLAASGLPDPLPTPPPAWTSLEPAPVVTRPFSGVGNQYVMDVTAYRDGFVAVGEDFRSDSQVAAAIWVTPDGTTWHRLPTADNQLADAVLGRVTTDGTRLVAMGHPRKGPDADPYDRAVWLSDDAEHWRLEPPDPALAAIDGIAGVAGGPAGFVVWGNTSNGAAVLHSTNGSGWEAAASPASFDGAAIADVQPYRSGFVAVGAHVPPRAGGGISAGGPDESTALGWWSADGRAWQTATADAGPGLQWVEVGSSGLLGLGKSGCGPCISPMQLWHSADARSWQRIGTDLGHWPTYASYGGRIIRFDYQDSDDVSWSTDGTSWTSIGQLTRDATYGLTIGSRGLLIEDSIVKGETPEDVDGGMSFVAARP
jgi:hypothetical protein